ncbi:hypothetical protein M0813_09012 [Anaeramoeba flamelloides]|uniref:Uncharacterized protein n=1 Tax=Anaeramoeba flamelloides TaxID=1746091 RepID=A0ABQ8X7M3_9EUKA|nr:hypothetical protein M0813_09012 [Anaeramoeba flamelloides]
MAMGYALLKSFDLKYYSWDWKKKMNTDKNGNENETGTEKKKEQRNNKKRQNKKNRQKSKNKNKQKQNIKKKKNDGKIKKSLTGINRFSLFRRIPKPSEGVGNLFTGDKTLYRWHLFDSPKKFLAWCFLILIMLVIELNSFFLKRPLWVPSNHPLTILRVGGWGFWGIVAVRDYFEYFTNPNCKKIGPDAWICLAIAIVESLLSFKFSEGTMPHSFPPIVKYGWISAFVIFWAWFFWFFFIKKWIDKKNKKDL